MLTPFKLLTTAGRQVIQRRSLLTGTATVLTSYAAVVRRKQTDYNLTDDMLDYLHMMGLSSDFTEFHDQRLKQRDKSS